MKKIDFKKKFYKVDTNGDIIAFKFIELTKNQPYGYSRGVIKRADLKQYEVYDVVFDFYETIDDAKYRKNKLKLNDLTNIQNSLFDLDYENIPESPYYSVYVFKNGEPIRLVLDKVFDFINSRWLEPFLDCKYYKTESECRADNTVIVIDFAD